MTESRVILVTGGNRGIGYEICKGILGHVSILKDPVTVLVGSRDSEKGQNAVKSLKEFAPDGSSISTVTIDVTSDESIIPAKEQIEKEYGKLDILILNAAIGIPSGDKADVRRIYNEVLNTNVSSSTVCIETFVPLLRKPSVTSPRIIIVSSNFGSLEVMANPSIPHMIEWLPYSVSKAALNMHCIGYSRELSGNGKKEIKVWGANPGFCKTEINGFIGTKDPADGAKSTIILATTGNEDVGKYQVGRLWEFEDEEMRTVPY